MRSRSRGPRISSARPADQTAQVSTRPSRRRRARVSRRLAPRGLVRTLASFRRDISSCTSGAPSNSRGNCAPAAVDDASGSASSLRPKPCRPAPTPREAGVLHAARSARGVQATSSRVAQTCVQETGCGTVSRRLRHFSFSTTVGTDPQRGERLVVRCDVCVLRRQDPHSVFGRVERRKPKGDVSLMRTLTTTAVLVPVAVDSPHRYTGGDECDRREACGKPGCDNFGKPGLNIVGHGWFVTKSGRRRRYRCTVCGGPLSTNTGTAYRVLHCSRREFDQVASLRVEGVSISVTARVTGHSRTTIARWLERASTAAACFNHRLLRDFGRH